MDIQLTDFQLEELRNLMGAMSSTRAQNNSQTGEITMGGLKVEWEPDVIHFVISGGNIDYFPE